MIRFINEAIDWDQESVPRDHYIIIDFGSTKIKVLNLFSIKKRDENNETGT